MSDVVVQEAVTGSVSPGAGRVGDSRPLWFVAMLAQLVTAPRRSQRGLVTVEFIFGIILVIAIISVVVSVIHNPAVGKLLLELVSWLLGLIKGVKA